MRPMPRPEGEERPGVNIDGLAIAALAQGPPPSPETVSDFIEGREFPIVEGRYCTFLFQGEVGPV